MKEFKYVAMDPRGAETTGLVEANSQSEAITMIRNKGMFPTRVSEVGEAKPKKKYTKITIKSVPKKKKPKKKMELSWDRTPWWVKFLVTISGWIAFIVTISIIGA